MAKPKAKPAQMELPLWQPIEPMVAQVAPALPPQPGRCAALGIFRMVPDGPVQGMYAVWFDCGCFGHWQNTTGECIPWFFCTPHRWIADQAEREAAARYEETMKGHDTRSEAAESAARDTIPALLP